MDQPVGTFVDEEWESLSSSMFSSNEAADFMLQLHGHFQHHNSDLGFGTSSTFWPNDHEANRNTATVDESFFIFSDHDLNTNFYYFSQENSNYTTSSSTGNNNVLLPTSSHVNHCYSQCNQNISPVVLYNTTLDLEPAVHFQTMDNKSNNNSAGDDIFCMKEEIMNDPSKELQLKRKFDVPEVLLGEEYMNNTNSKSTTPKKKSRVSNDHAQKAQKKATTFKKIHKLTDQNEAHTGANGQSYNCYSTENDSNGSQQELNGGANSSAGFILDEKTRASKGSATDPQSLYARRRRERINERLRILQSLVPNGTKVDISTMLEEAVHYVKFLQQQIRLLSCDDLWMYAPIAYNGMDTGLCPNISSNLCDNINGIN